MALLALVFFCYFSEANADTLGTSDCSTDGTTNYITGTACAGTAHTQSTVTIQDGLTGGTVTGSSTEVGTGYNGFVRFKHNPGSWAIQHAITQALAGSGLKIDGYRTTFEYRNNQTNTIDGACLVEKVNGVCIDPLTLTITAKSADGTDIYEQTFDYGQAVTDDWVQEQILSWVGDRQLTPGTDISTVDILLQGYDAGYWLGNYGPKVRNMVGDIIVSTDICTNTPLHSTSCPGYADAYASTEYDTQCSSNALYDSGCPGYASAYYNQQCSADPLYDSGCSGYANAYYNQQCSADPLYDTSCPGYADTYYNKQCKADPLYDSGCDGYATAYYNQQCSASALYDSGCPGYASAYYDQQCSASALYDSGCPNYNWANTDYTQDLTNKAGQGSDYIEIVKADGSDVWNALFYNESELDNGDWVAKCKTYANGCEDAVITSASFNYNGNHYAFLYTKDKDGNTFIPTRGHRYNFMTETKFDALCDSTDSLYSPMCGGYATAYYNQQCESNPLYDSGCSGYAQAYEDQQCSANPLYSTNCSGYATAYYNQQCSANPLYDSGCSGYSTAYYNQQCGISALYDSTCPGYATAYFNQQCTANALYDSQCPGYATAYLNQQCSLNTLYDSQCPGYATAYFNQQCGISALYDSACPGYAAAYFSQQCTASGLYDTTCPNYETAYFDNQCSINALYNPGCPGYTVAVVIDDATPDIDDGTATAEDIAGDTAEIISVESITEVSITGDVVVDSIINDTPIIEVIEETTTETFEIVVVEEIVPVEIVVESAFDKAPVVASFNSFVITGPVIAPLASNAQIEQQAETVQLEILVESIEAEVEFELTQLDTNISEAELEVEVETMSELIVDELEVEEIVVEEVVEEVVEKETPEEETTKEEVAEETTTKEEVVEEVVEKETPEEEVKETVVAEEKPKVIIKPKMTAEQRATAKRLKMKEIVKNKLASLAKDMATASSLNEQAAIQAQISALINFLPGFNTYGGQVQIAGDFYGSDSVYNTSKMPENQRGLLNGLASQIKHEAMVDMQYK